MATVQQRISRLGFACGLGLMACASQQPAHPTFGAEKTNADYETITKEWTAQDILRGSSDDHWSELAHVYATYKAPAWREAARQQMYGDLQIPVVAPLPPSSTEQTRTAEEESSAIPTEETANQPKDETTDETPDESNNVAAEASNNSKPDNSKPPADSVEIEILMATYDRRINDLNKGERSAWRVFLVGDDGRAIPAIRVERDRRPRGLLQREYPHMKTFFEPYVAYFPAEHGFFNEGAKKCSLVLASHIGKLTLTWINAQAN